MGGRRTQTMKSPLGNARTVPCVPRPPHHVGTVSLCQRWWWQSLRCEGWWDGETPPARDTQHGSGSSVVAAGKEQDPHWHRGRLRTLTHHGPVWDPPSGTPAHTVTLCRRS